MSTNTIAFKGSEALSGQPQAASATSKVAGKSLFRRLFDKIAANAERQALARLAVVDPRLAAELRAAKDRHEAQAQV